jgi:prepilin-type N-terminal cleavage/methylation domain-containing protein
MSAARPGARAGFTLVEVLLTLLIMSFILVGISEILTGARKTRDRIHNIQERQLAGPAILDRIESDLRALVTYDRDAGQVLRVRNRVLTGYDADTLDFVSSTNSLAPWREHENEDFRRADFNEVGYRLRPNPDSDDFLEIYRREDFGIDDEPFDGGGFSLLHDRVKGFDIEVYSEDGPDAEPIESWSSEDDENVGLPTRIDIELTLELAPRLVREQLVIDGKLQKNKEIGMARFQSILSLFLIDF